MLWIGPSLAISAVLLAPAAEPIELGWHAPAECPTADEVRAGVALLLGAQQSTERVRVDVTVEHQPHAYVAKMVLEIGTRRSERELVATRCDALGDAAALVIAVTVDPAQVPVPPEPAPIVPEPAIEPPPRPIDPGPSPHPAARVEPDAPVPVQSRRRRVGMHVRGFGGLDLGATPGPTGTLGAAVGLRGRRFRVEVDGSWAFARSRDLPGIAGVRAAVARGSFAVRGCGVPARGRIEVPLCGAVEVGALLGRGAGDTVHARSVARPWVAITGGPALAISVVPRLAVVIGADLVVPLWRASFEIGGVDAFRPRSVGMRALLGVELRLGAPR